MEIPEWIAVGSVVVALVSLAVQQHFTLQQTKADARDRHSDRTQELIFKALEDPALLKAISGNAEEEQKERRYRQLWFNHMEMFFRSRKLFGRAHWRGSVNDFRSFMNMPVMRQHWQENGRYYAKDFQAFMEKEIMTKGAEAPTVKPPLPQTQASST